MAIRNIIKKGDEILNKHSKEIKEITPRILELLDDMKDTLHHCGNGVGHNRCRGRLHGAYQSCHHRAGG